MNAKLIEQMKARFGSVSQRKLDAVSQISPALQTIIEVDMPQLLLIAEWAVRESDDK